MTNTVIIIIQTICLKTCWKSSKLINLSEAVRTASSVRIRTFDAYTTHMRLESSGATCGPEVAQQQRMRTADATLVVHVTRVMSTRQVRRLHPQTDHPQNGSAHSPLRPLRSPLFQLPPPPPRSGTHWQTMSSQRHPLSCCSIISKLYNDPHVVSIDVELSRGNLRYWLIDWLAHAIDFPCFSNKNHSCHIEKEYELLQVKQIFKIRIISTNEHFAISRRWNDVYH